MNNAKREKAKRTVTHRPNWNNPDGFETCCFCGATPHIMVCDDEGNDHTDEKDYEKNPWSGLKYSIEHTVDTPWKKGEGDIPNKKECPLATYMGDGRNVGMMQSTTRKEAVAWWNAQMRKARMNPMIRSKVGFPDLGDVLRDAGEPDYLVSGVISSVLSHETMKFALERIVKCGDAEKAREIAKECIIGVKSVEKDAEANEAKHRCEVNTK